MKFPRAFEITVIFKGVIFVYNLERICVHMCVFSISFPS